MNVNEFIEKYNNSEKKNFFVKRHIVKKYVNLNAKFSNCEKIINSCNYVDVNNNKIYKKNSVSQNYVFIIMLIECYTDIVLENGLSDLDKLNELDLINVIIENIPLKEYNEFSSILEMMTNDMIDKEESIVGLINKYMVSNPKE